MWKTPFRPTAGKGQHVGRDRKAGRPRAHRPFEAWEVVYLLKEAGFKSLSTLASETDRDEAQLEILFAALGISATLIAPELFICPECGCARTYLNAKGRCRVCQLSDNLQAEDGRVADLLQRLPPDVRAGFDRGENQRGHQKPLPSLPKRTSLPRDASSREKRLAETAYQAAIEEWQTVRVQRAYDASKQRYKDVKAKAKKAGIIPDPAREPDLSETCEDAETQLSQSQKGLVSSVPKNGNPSYPSL